METAVRRSVCAVALACSFVGCNSNSHDATGPSGVSLSAGSITGTLSGTTLTGSLSSNAFAPIPPPSCPATITASVNGAGTEISGLLATVNCSVSVSDTFTVTKQ